MGVTIEADIIKQKQPENNGGYLALDYGKTSPLVYDQLTTDNPIDLTRWQVANCYMGRIGLINSGGESKGAGDLAEAVRTAVINKRAGGQGLISGRKAFQRPMAEGVELLHAIQDVYLDGAITHRLKGRERPTRPFPGSWDVHDFRPTGVPSFTDMTTRISTWGRVANDRYGTSRRHRRPCTGWCCASPAIPATACSSPATGSRR